MTEVVTLELIRTDRIRMYADPFRTEAWPGIPLELSDVSSCLDLPLLSRPIQIQSQLLPTKQDHCRRIAYFVKNGWSDPIDFDLDAAIFGQWPIFDGNHRLAAAIFRADETILAEIHGRSLQYGC